LPTKARPPRKYPEKKNPKSLTLLRGVWLSTREVRASCSAAHSLLADYYCYFLIPAVSRQLACPWAVLSCGYHGKLSFCTYLYNYSCDTWLASLLIY
uniref:Uncharacterized protein n=1 Tax=Dromaius novaehollandiae TaxID=8790 RepID=A0A8C4JUM5_DRONO